MLRVNLSINIDLEGPILTQSSIPGNFGSDLVVARHEDNTPYIPGTLITGKLRQSLEEINSAIAGDNTHWFTPDLDQWLGERNEYGTPKTKQLYFSDFDLIETSQGQTKENAIRDRIKIDKKRGAVSKHQIVMIENPFISGEIYTFSGNLHFFCMDETQAGNIIKHIEAGLKWFTQLGALRTVGYGKVTETSITNTNKLLISSPTSNYSSNKILTLEIKPEYPFCIATKPKADNLFDSEVIIPGSSIIASIATTWNHLTGVQGSKTETVNDPDRKKLKDNFSKIRISHAFPSDTDKRPVVAPLSLVTIEDNPTLYDVAQLSTPCLINKKPPDFSLDWKNKANTLTEYPWPFIRMESWGWSRVNSELRVRTAIHREKLRSKDQELFAYTQIIPKDQTWFAQLDLSRITDEDERKAVLSELTSLIEHGVSGLGKTKSPIQLAIKDKTPESCFSTTAEPINNNQWLVTLQTDALLGSPETLNETSRKEQLEAMYQQTWQSLSNNSLKLVRYYFARQKLSGGRHRKNIYQKKNQPYKPWLLTEAGSIFVLQTSKDTSIEQAQKLIQEWQLNGLPLSKEACNYYDISTDISKQWRDTPFISQNGYGEIAVNIDTDNKTTQLTDQTANPELTSITELAETEEA